ncbi:MAG: alanine racemase [Nitrospinota bacterium]|nr:alanine racemase [Nitrospinota bacterium]
MFLQFKTDKNSLLADGVAVERIVAKTGSPVYVYDASVMARQFGALAGAVPRGFRIFYSIKANPNLAVVKIFRELGCGAEVASAHELMTALAAGVPKADIIYAGPGKSPQEIELAVQDGIGAINAESATEVERIIATAEALGKKANVAIRINLDYTHDDGEGGHVMAGGPRKFGVDAEAAPALARRLIEAGHTRFVGFHLFPGTGIMDPRILQGAHTALARFCLKMAEELQTPIKYVNFGGGLGIPYRDGEPELDIAQVGAALGQAADLLRQSPWFSGARFIMEPGRYLVGPSGVYVSTITDVKVSRGKTYAVTDGGIHHALIPIVMNKNYPTALVNRMDEPPQTQVRVGGPLCATPDQFSRDVTLPTPRLGDLVGIFNSGAYGLTAGMNAFLSHPTPAEALVDNRRVYLIRPRQAPQMGIKERIRL